MASFAQGNTGINQFHNIRARYQFINKRLRDSLPHTLLST
jgi:hypothetical protein